MKRLALMTCVLVSVSIASAQIDRALRPAEGGTLNYTQIGFWWPPHDGADGYELEIVVDDASADPFAQTASVMRLEVSDEPRYVVTEGIEFGRDYAWRVTSLPDRLTGKAHRFSTAPLPDVLPALQTRVGLVVPQPGITLFNVRKVGTARAIAMAVDRNGKPVFFTNRPVARRSVQNIELSPTGRLIMNRGDIPAPLRGATVAVEETLDGAIVWKSPRELTVHHDSNVMPDGNLMVLEFEFFQDRGDERLGDRIVVLDRQTSDELWSWKTSDHYDLDDGDPGRDWVHGNAAVYNPLDNSVYFSARHMNWITRIDFDTGQIIYNLGGDQPSGLDTFGNGFFTYQHAPEPQPDGNLLVFNNGNFNTPRQTSAVEVAFDDPAAPTTAEIVWEWRVVDEFGNPVFSAFVGDADRLPNGNTLLTTGPQGRLVEVDREGNLAWSLQLSAPFPRHLIYRAERIDSLIVDAPGDTNGDWDLDLLDFAELQRSFGRSGGGFVERLSDMDGDSDVDAADAAQFAQWSTGPIR